VTIFSRLSQYPALLEHLSLSNLHGFIVSAARLKNDIFLAQPSSQPLEHPPEYLPLAIQNTLSSITDIPLWLIPQCWLVVRDLVWSDDYVAKLQPNPQEVFAAHGLDRGLGM
jgi:hypothetical protein